MPSTEADAASSSLESDFSSDTGISFTPGPQQHFQDGDANNHSAPIPQPFRIEKLNCRDIHIEPNDRRRCATDDERSQLAVLLQVAQHDLLNELENQDVSALQRDIVSRLVANYKRAVELYCKYKRQKYKNI